MQKQSSLVNKKGKCKFCDKVYGAKKNTENKWVFNAFFCEAQCRNDYYAQMPKYKKCIVCKKVFKDRSGGDKIYCTQHCYWKNLKKIHPPRNKDCYVKIQIKGKSMYKHRRVMELHIGRKLTTDEIVHHINGDLKDNSIENLELGTQSEHIKEHFKKIKWGRVKK